MPTYHVKIGFWLRAYDGFDIEAGSDAEAVSVAKAQALDAMESTAQPQQIEMDQRREGIICWIDRSAVGGPEISIAEDVAFDDDRIHSAGNETPQQVSRDETA